LTRAVFWLAISGACSLGAGRLFTVEDLWQEHTASDPQITADGERVAFVEEWKDARADRVFANIRIALSDGKNLTVLTQGAWRDSNPRWSPDGTQLAYLSDRGGTAQIFIRRMGSSEDVQLTRGSQAALALGWSPDGNAIAYTAPVPVKYTPPQWAPPSILPYLQHGRESRVQLFIARLSGGAPRQITNGSEDCHGEPAWTDDGSLVLTSRLPAGGDALEGDEIYAVRVADGAIRRLTERAGPDEHPVVSPDGSKVAYLGYDYRAQTYVNTKLYVMATDGSRVKMLSGLLDRDAAEPHWSSDSRTVYFLADDDGATRVYAGRGDGTLRPVNAVKGRLRGFSLADNGRAVSVRSTVGAASEVVTFAVDVPSEATTIAAVNTAWLASREAGAVEEVGYSSGVYTIQGWVVKPPGFDGSKKYPLILDILDGPGTMYGAEFNLRAQLLASHGFVVLCINPRGSVGYGEQFGNLLPTRFPGDDFDDLMRGVDYLLPKGYIDEKRLMVVGGLTAAWSIGHTDRFRAAVLRRPVVDWATDVATRPDGTRRAAHWMQAAPWENPGRYISRSPLYSAKEFKTPVLVLAGERDDPESQELAFALRARQVETELLRLPDPERPSTQIVELDATLAWFDRFGK
jgi:acylaminoacyl-peptidase